MRRRLNVPLPEDFTSFPVPCLASIPEKHRPAYTRRLAGVQAVAAGLSVERAAKVSSVNRSVLARVLDEMNDLAPDGKPFGYRACIPYYVRKTRFIEGATLPRQRGPGSFLRMLKAVPSVAALADGYSGTVGNRRRTRAFLRLHKAITAELERLGHVNVYPLNAPDKGRRALADYLRRREIERLALAAEPPGDDGGEHLSGFLKVPPFTRLELDEHDSDVNWFIDVAGEDGTPVQAQIRKVKLIVVIDAGSGAICGWFLLLDRDYDQHDIISLVAQQLTRWQPRELTTPNLAYAPSAGMPSSMFGGASLPRGCVVCLDNHMSHIAEAVAERLVTVYGGVVNYGRAHHPTARPHIEALFKQIEEKVFRQMPGGYRPSSLKGEPNERTNDLDPKLYPVDKTAVEELLDVIFTQYNATALKSLGYRSPLDAVRRHLDAGGWDIRLPEPERDAIELNIQPIVRITIHGSRRGGKPPYCQFLYGTYRSPPLDSCWDLIGSTCTGSVDRRDLRFLTLYHQGKVLAVLRVRPPWSHTAHDATERRLAHKAARENPAAFAGAEDYIACYRALLRSNRRHPATLGAVPTAPGSVTPPLIVDRFMHPLPPPPVPRTGWVELSADGEPLP